MNEPKWRLDAKPLNNRTLLAHVQMPSKTMMRAWVSVCILALREFPTLSSATVQQAPDSAAQFNSVTIVIGQGNHLVVPSADALDEVEHLSKTSDDRIHTLVALTHLHALAQRGPLPGQLPGLRPAAVRTPSSKGQFRLDRKSADLPVPEPAG